ncbi:MAG: tetratricopeptide repeat protein [bacterium]|nr:tetratricopeptide repeat protein [bacterium]
MSDEQHGGQEAAVGSMTRVLFGKVFHRRVFSERALLWVLLATAFLLPLFFIPGQLIAPEFSKMVLLEALVLVGIFFWAAARLRDGYVDIPKSLLLLVSALLVVQFVAAAIVSPAPIVSFIGSGYDLGTVNSFVLLFLLMFLCANVFRSRDRIILLYGAFLASGVLVMLYHLLRQIFGETFLAFDVFTSAVATPVGRWNDMASLMGGLLLVVLTTLYFFPQNKQFRIPALVLFLLGLFFLLIVNFTSLWLMLAVLVGLLVVLAVYEGEREHKKKIREATEGGAHHPHRPLHRRIPGHLPSLAVVLLLVAVVYGSGLSNVSWGKDGATVASKVAQLLRATPYSEVMLTPKFTYDIVKETIVESPFFGTGPNRFASAYLKYKVNTINVTPFWDTTFEFGLGRIPTYFGTTGLIGMALWILFVVLLFLKGKKTFALLAKDRVAAYLGFSLFLLALYFWSLSFFYLPNITIFAFAFLFTGALIAFLSGEGLIGRFHVPFGEGSRLSFVLTPVAIMVLVGTIACGVLFYRQASSLILFREAQVASAAGNVASAEQALLSANALTERDLYLRALSSLALVKLQALPSQNLSQDELATKAKQLIDDARLNAERAIKLDPTNFENYLQLGGVFDTLGTFGIQNTTPFARENYEQALRLNPKSPRVLFMLARLEFTASDRAKTKEYLYRALAERPNFTEALSFLVDLELQDRNFDAALAAVRAGVQAEPTNFILHFGLGYLNYLNGDRQGALTEFESAVILNPQYADAKYFLGLVYFQLGRSQEAIQQFTDVQTLNPDNKEVVAILQNLKAGRDPFAGLSTPQGGAQPAQVLKEGGLVQ